MAIATEVMTVDRPDGTMLAIAWSCPAKGGEPERITIEVPMMKPMITLFALFGMAACSTPTERTQSASVNVAQAEQQLASAKTDAAQSVSDAREAGATQVDQAAKDLKQARMDLQKRLDETDAQIAALDAKATTAEQRAEIKAIRVRQAAIVAETNGHDGDDGAWRKMKADVDQALDDLGRDIKKIGSKDAK